MKAEAPKLARTGLRYALRGSLAYIALAAANQSAVAAHRTSTSAQAASIQRVYGIKPQLTDKAALKAVKRQLRKEDGILGVLPLEVDVEVPNPDGLQSCKVKRPIAVPVGKTPPEWADQELFAVQKDTDGKQSSGDLTTAGGIGLTVTPLGNRSELDRRSLKTPKDFIARASGIHTLTGSIVAYNYGEQLKVGLLGHDQYSVTTLDAAAIDCSQASARAGV